MKELLEKYFSNNISEHELAEIRQYFSTHENELQKYFSEEGWEEEKYEHIKNELLPDDVPDDWFEPRHRNIRTKQITYTLLAACACLALFFGINRFFFSGWPRINKSGVTVYENNRKENQSIILPDSSIVTLSPHARIVLAADYNQENRNIELYGNAVFKVHKDTLRRFTVFSGNITTTAVGTEFDVNNTNGKNVLVKLLEGKILVRERNNNTKSYYLLPGKTIAYENKTRQFNIIDNKDVNKNMPAGNYTIHGRKHLDMATIPSDSQNGQDNQVAAAGIIRKSDQIVFSDIELPDVLKELAGDYNVKIAYPVGRASTIRFAGSIDRKQDIRKILSDIAIMNNFHIEEDTASQSFRLY